MSDRHDYWTYIMASMSRVLYVGVTSDLQGRVSQHKLKLIEGFTKKYNCTRLVWYEQFREIRDAIDCETRIKGWLRAKKIALIEQLNPEWKDLSAGWFEGITIQKGRDSSLGAQNDSLRESAR